MKVLFLFANAFPFGTWEPYLETEVEHYGVFDRVEIFSLSVRAEQLKDRREIEDPRIGVHVLPFRSKAFYALQAVRALVDVEFYRELRLLAKQDRISFGRLVQLLVFLSRTHFEARMIGRMIDNESLVAQDDAVALYAYRFAYQPYLAELVGRQINAPSIRIARAHGGDLYERVAQNEYIPLRGRVADSVDVVHMVSEHGRQYLIERHPEITGKIVTSRLGTVDRGLAPEPESDGVIRIITCSAAVRVKRLDRLIDALAMWDLDVPLHWVHYGDGPLLQNLKQEAKLRSASNVTVDFRGEIDNSDLLRVYATEGFHALINVSESEGLPVSMMEACSFGIPVIATDVGGVNEIIKDGQNGTLLRSAPTPEEIVSALSALVEQVSQSDASFRFNARRIWEQNFRADHNYGSFAEEVVQRLDVLKRTS